jgi:hypothetical protein
MNVVNQGLKALYDILQAIYDRSQKAQSPKNCIPELCDFTEKLINNPLLEHARQEIIEDGKNLMKSLTAFKAKSFIEINQTRILLAPYRGIVQPIVKTNFSEN